MTLAYHLMAKISLALQADDGRTFWMPPQGSTVAESVDSAFYFIYWISVFFFIGIVAAMVIFVVKYRSSSGKKRKKAPHHNLALELTWTIIPLIIPPILPMCELVASMAMRGTERATRTTTAATTAKYDANSVHRNFTGGRSSRRGLSVLR